MKWININTKRPPEFEVVIVKGNISSHNPGVSTGCWVDMKPDIFWFEGPCCCSLVTRIDHEVEFWMPLPKYEDKI